MKFVNMLLFEFFITARPDVWEKPLWNTWKSFPVLYASKKFWVRLKNIDDTVTSSHQILLNLRPDLVSSPLGTFDPLLQWRRRVLRLLLHQVLWSELVTSGYQIRYHSWTEGSLYINGRKRAGFQFWVICWSVSVYLQLSFFLLQHFPEYLSGMFLYFWVLKHTFTTNIVNKYDNLYVATDLFHLVLMKNNSIWEYNVIHL